MRTLEIIKKMNKGETVKQIEEQLKKISLQKSKEKGKMFGTCESCGQETSLVKEVGLCGPCCFGEADTADGNW